MSKYFIGDLMVAQASKTIKKGEEVALITSIMLTATSQYFGKREKEELNCLFQITENYHPTAMVMERDERQKYLESSYNFTCACKACDSNLPTIR